MDTFAASLIVRALDGLSARATATAQNIANAGTTGYRPVRVSFEDALANAARSGRRDAVDAVQPRLSHDPASGGELRLDLELATESTTAARYAALVEILNHQLGLERAAISGSD